jgi:hypothetical protein
MLWQEDDPAIIEALGPTCRWGVQTFLAPDGCLVSAIL